MTAIIIKEKKRKAREANAGFVEAEKREAQDIQSASSVAEENKEN